MTSQVGRADDTSDPATGAALPGQVRPEPVGGTVGVLHGAVTAEISRRVRDLQVALEQARDVIDPVVTAKADAALARITDRLALGVDRTVVAIVGGTGSGKSSLFNAVTRLQFADVGDTRPTTALPSACVWGPDGDALLDWLGVDRHRRIQRESLLDGDEEASLAGLVLLDLPDHDSVEATHREVVDRVLPYADLVLWVVDPQKYADDALHTGYLRDLVGHEESTVVVLNQVDTVPVDQRDALVEDLARLLAEDGLVEVPLLGASAVTGEGVVELRERLEQVVARRSSAATHAAAEVRDVAATVVASLGPSVRPPDDDDVSAVVDTLAGAAGLRAVSDAVVAALRSGTALPDGFGSVHDDGAELARSQWLTRTTGDLLPAWADEVTGRVATPAELRMAVAEALSAVTLGVRRNRAARAAWWAGFGLMVLAVAGAGVAYAAVGFERLPVWALPAAAGAVVLGALVMVAGTVGRRVDARRQAERVGREGRAVIDAVARARLADPTTDVLARHARLRGLVEATRVGD
ncbi:MAG: 50S ribosome-binding GTPase [Cellulomonas sp.]|nr:50S ribosome-binding GTPase [Cellulomonas sp.]